MRLQVVVTETERDRIEEWRRVQRRVPTLSNALRTLINGSLDRYEADLKSSGKKGK